MEFVKPFVGSWTMKVESAGEVVEGTWTGRPSPTKACYVTLGEGAGRPSFQSIDGFDPATKAWTVVAFGSDGAFTIHRLRFDNVKDGRHYSKGDVGIGETIVNQPDGKVVKMTSKGTCLECTADRIVYVVSDRMVNGEPAPDEKWTMERRPAKKNASP